MGPMTFPEGRTGTGQETLGEVWDGSETSGTDQGTLGEFREGSGNAQEGL